MCLSTFQPSARHPWIHLCLAQNSQHSCASSTPSTVSAEAAAAGQAGASPDQAVSAGHPHTPQAPPEPLTPCCPRQTLLPCGQEGQEPSCHIAGQTHSCIHSCSTCLALGSGVSRPTRKHAAPCMQACLSWPLCHACLQHEVSLLASVQGSKPTRHGCTDMLHWRSMPMLLDDSHMAKHETCQPPPPCTSRPSQQGISQTPQRSLHQSWQIFQRSTVCWSLLWGHARRRMTLYELVLALLLCLLQSGQKLIQSLRLLNIPVLVTSTTYSSGSF